MGIKYVFNPTTGNLDATSVETPAGSNTQIQFNDAGSFGGDVDLTWNKTTNVMTVAGDVNLSDGGSFTTTLQTITPTANRTVSIPDATGTLALVAGSSGQLVYNNAGVYAGIPGSTVGASGNVTLNASSGFTGNLLDLQVNGTSQVSSSAAGVLKATGFAANGTNTPRSFALGDSTSTRGLEFFTGGNRLYYREGASTVCSFGLSSGLLFSSTQPLGWCPTSPDGNADLSLFRDAANTLAQRNGTSAQVFRIYNTYTSSTNYELGKLEWSSNAFRIGTEKGSGGGTARNLELQTDGTTRWTISASSGSLQGGANASIYTEGGIGRVNYSYISFPAVDGNITLNNWNANGFNRLQFGGTTSSFPALKRNSAVLETKLADDSAYAQHAASVFQAATAHTVATLPATPVVGMIARVTDATAPAVGVTVTGGGSAAALCWYNGTNWTVIGV